MNATGLYHWVSLYKLVSSWDTRKLNPDISGISLMVSSNVWILTNKSKGYQMEKQIYE